MTNDFPQQLAGFHRDLLRFATLQLRNEAAAEDAVQECMLAALNGTQNFANRAQLKTWVFAILKNKIVDTIRQRVREPNLEKPEEEVSDIDFDPLFDEYGHWNPDDRPAHWGDPVKDFENARFLAVLEACLNRLPASTAQVFMMREMLGLTTDEICSELALSSSNCWVVLHRARMSLRLCLDRQWFGQTREAT
jgi:RNA polymerase sigma-70 factor (ECF subfamily)